MKTQVIGVNEWAKTGDKGKPQPDGFTPEGGLVRSSSNHYHDHDFDCGNDDDDDDDCNFDSNLLRERSLAWRSSMESGTTPPAITG